MGEQRNEDKWLDDKLNGLHNDIDGLRKEIRGNGKTGLAGRVRSLEALLYDNPNTGQAGIVSRLETVEGQRRESKWILRAVAAYLLAEELGVGPGEVIRAILGL